MICRSPDAENPPMTPGKDGLFDAVDHLHPRASPKSQTPAIPRVVRHADNANVGNVFGQNQTILTVACRVRFGNYVNRPLSSTYVMG
jgi:hypothetical protein